MSKNINLTDEQIKFYEKVSGYKIEGHNKDRKGEITSYIVILKNGSKCWKTGADILGYLKYKTVKDIDKQLEAINNETQQNAFIFKKKEWRGRKTITLTNDQINKVMKNATYFKISFSSVIAQLIDKNL